MRKTRVPKKPFFGRNVIHDPDRSLFDHVVSTLNWCEVEELSIGMESRAISTTRPAHSGDPDPVTTLELETRYGHDPVKRIKTPLEEETYEDIRSNVRSLGVILSTSIREDGKDWTLIFVMDARMQDGGKPYFTLIQGRDQKASIENMPFLVKERAICEVPQRLIDTFSPWNLRDVEEGKRLHKAVYDDEDVTKRLEDMGCGPSPSM